MPARRKMLRRRSMQLESASDHRGHAPKKVSSYGTQYRSRLRECAVHHGKSVITLDVVDVGDAKNRAKSAGVHLHRARFWRSSWRGLWKSRGHCSVKSDVTFYFFHGLMDMPVQHRDRAKPSQKPERLF